MRKISATSREARTAAAVWRCLSRNEKAELVERAGHGAYRSGRYLGIEGGVLQLGVAEQGLDHPDIDAVFQQMGGKAVAQRVRANPLGNLRRPCCLDDDAMQLAGADWPHRALAREQPALCVHHAQLPSGLPPLAQQGQQICRQHGIAIPATPRLRGGRLLPRSTRISLRSLSMSATLSAATSATRRPAP